MMIMPISSKKVLFLLAAPGVALAGCSVTVSSTNGDAGSDAGPTTTGMDSGGTVVDAGATDADAGASAEAGKLGFVASNLPSGMTLAAPGDWVFSSQRCGGRTSVQIDTSKGTSDCDGQAAPYQYSAITQSDMSLGSLQAAVFVTNKFTVETGMTVTVVGNLPLIVVALGDANISGVLNGTVNDLSSEKANGGGASGAPHNANGNGPGGGTAPVGASGAGGGGFCGMGGDGPAAGDAGVTGGTGGKTYGAATNVPLVGGSAGGSGSYGAGGGGGGAIQIVSASSIQVTAVGAINVAGGGGNWSRSGGGSGGAILLQAPSVLIAGTLAANGGGGAESGINNNGQRGKASASPAAGGSAESNSSTGAQLTNGGGTGAAGVTVDGTPGQVVVATSSGGGGGGAAGRIRIDTSSGSATVGMTAVVSPALTTSCATQGTLMPSP